MLEGDTTAMVSPAFSALGMTSCRWAQTLNRLMANDSQPMMILTFIFYVNESFTRQRYKNNYKL